MSGAEHAVPALRFQPALPVWLIAALALVCLAALAVAAWRRAPGTVWRALAFAVLLGWLAGPRLVEETRQTLPDIGLLVIDQSASMSVADRTHLAGLARQRIEQQAHGLRDLELRTITVPEQGSEGTRLFAAIDRALADVPRARLAGIVAITDGQIHDVPTEPPGGVPFHALLTAKGEETDRRIRIIEAPEYGIVGKTVQLRVAVDDLGVAHGLLNGGPGAATLTIRRDGEPPTVESVPVGREHVIDVPITRAGPTVIALSVDELPGEVSTANNTAVVQINGVRDRLRVLLVSGEPHQGERTWRRLLKSDPAVDLVHFTILRPPEKDDMTPLKELALIAFPVRELFMTKIDQFDLIILDRFQNRGTLPPIYLHNIADYVRGGGALLLDVGPEYLGDSSLANGPLADVLLATAPDDGAVDAAFRPSVTALGMRHPVTADLPGVPTDPSAAQSQDGVTPSWGRWYRRIVPIESRGEALLAGPDRQPLLLLDRMGQGRVAMLMSDQIWLWSRGHDGGGPQAELLRRVAHWLMKEPELEETALTASVDNGRLTVERRSIDAASAPAVSVTAPDGSRTSLTLNSIRPGRTVGSMPASAPGVWQASDGTRTAYAAAGAANPLEMADLRATASKLAPLVRSSRGSIHWLAPGGAPAVLRTEPTSDQSGGDWIGMERRHDHLIISVAALPLLPTWAALPLLLGLVVVAWRREAD
jgi:hypothetical protein